MLGMNRWPLELYGPFITISVCSIFVVRQGGFEECGMLRRKGDRRALE